MTQGNTQNLDYLLMTEPTARLKADPTDIPNCSLEYTPSGWVGGMGVFSTYAALLANPTNALVPGKVWAVVASADSVAKYNYMSSGWVVESSVGTTGASNLPGSPASPFTSLTDPVSGLYAWAALNLSTLLSGRSKAWVGAIEYVWNGPGSGSTGWEIVGESKVKPSAFLSYLSTLDHTSPTVTLTQVTVTGSSFGALPFTGAILLRLNAQTTEGGVSQPVSVDPFAVLNRGATWPYYTYVSAGYLQGGGGNFGTYRPIVSISTQSTNVAFLFQANLTTNLSRKPTALAVG